MTIIEKELNSDHVIGYGVKYDGDTNITVKFQFHPTIENWLIENKIVPTYVIKEEVPGYNVSVKGYEDSETINFKQEELKNSKFDVDEILEKISIKVPLSKHQFKFKFPTFSKTPVVNLTKEEKNELVSSGIWSDINYKQNS